MQVIIALGNPGQKYAKTRHNIAWMIIDALAVKLTGEKRPKWENKNKLQAQLLRAKNDMLLVKPQTYMNRSGETVKAVARMHNLKERDIWIVQDDSDIQVGKIKIVQSGSSGGHKGVQSILNHLQTQNIVRFKIGIRPAGNQKRSETFVLKPFGFTERSTKNNLINKSVEALLYAQQNGLETAMNRFHGSE